MSLESWWYFRRARFLLFLNRRDSAMHALRAVLAADPSNTIAMSMLGFLHGHRNGEDDIVEAERCFRAVIEQTPGDAQTLFNLGYILQKQDRHEEAIQVFDAALDIDATIDRAWFGKGMSLAALKRHADAVPAFERAAKLQPMNPHALHELGLQFHALGQRDKVAETVARLREFDPKATQQLRQATHGDPPGRATGAAS